LELSLKGQRALVTGANSGIGAGVARALAEAGAAVVVNYVANDEIAGAVVKEIQGKGGRAMAIKADVAKEDQVQAMFRQMIDAWGSIDILVNNAGLQKDAAFHDMTLREWQFVLDVNLTGQFLCAREAIRDFLRRSTT
jgi:glucose 1-dehydrogenase